MVVPVIDRSLISRRELRMEMTWDTLTDVVSARTSRRPGISLITDNPFSRMSSKSEACRIGGTVYNQWKYVWQKNNVFSASEGRRPKEGGLFL